MMDRYQFEFLSYLGKNKEVVLNYKKIADKIKVSRKRTLNIIKNFL